MTSRRTFLMTGSTFAIILLMTGCQGDCPEGFLRDNDGNCIQVSSDDQDDDTSNADTNDETDADTDSDSDSDTDADTDADADCVFFIGTWQADSFWVDDCQQEYDYEVIWTFTSTYYETWYESSGGGRSGEWHCEWDEGLLYMDNLEYSFSAIDGDSFSYVYDADSDSCGTLHRQ